ncbi:LOW QUALITY PROTEIN: tRNA-splicing endonuclease subunit Sen54 [Diretmus argenteus]
MADQNKTAAEGNFYSELLSPSELFAARSRSHKIPVRGQKDFFPNESEQQRQRLQQSLDEHWSLLSEERVERLGNLVKTVWLPEEQVVELQSPAGKFWQTMGFSANSKQCLHPEEALYLMECGNLQVFYRDLPLSIQDGYERFLSSKTITLQQYQVFGHLKRLGYVVNRFDPSSVASSYERQLNLPQSQDRAGKKLKRKRSPTSTSRRHHKPMPLARRTEFGAGAGGGPMFTPGRDTSQNTSPVPRWDFRSIPFPDLGSREGKPRELASPDPSLLPGALAVGCCNIEPWLRRLNLRKEKLSSGKGRRERDRMGWDVNKDKEVRRCRNWTEYLELQARRRRGRPSNRPAHLWEREVTPLHDPRQHTSTEELLDKISVVKSSHLLDGASRLKGSDEWRICFDVYQPDTVADFKKSNPGKPYSRMCVCSFDGPVPDLQLIKLLAFQSGDVPVVYAVVDHGDISFYTFKDFQLPTDVHH